MTTLQAWFNSVDKDRSGKISAQELAQMVFPGAPGSSSLAGRPIGLEVANKIIPIFDSAGVREISFFEYAALFEFCTQLQTAFQAADRNRTNKLGAAEVGQALSQAALPIGAAAVEQLVRARGGALDLGAFLNMALEAAEVKQHFAQLDCDRDGKLTQDEVYLLVARQQKTPNNVQCVIC